MITVYIYADINLICLHDGNNSEEKKEDTIFILKADIIK